jgi:hypothetical protein
MLVETFSVLFASLFGITVLLRKFNLLKNEKKHVHNYAEIVMILRNYV